VCVRARARTHARTHTTNTTYTCRDTRNILFSFDSFVFVPISISLTPYSLSLARSHAQLTHDLNLRLNLQKAKHAEELLQVKFSNPLSPRLLAFESTTAGLTFLDICRANDALANLKKNFDGYVLHSPVFFTSIILSPSLYPSLSPLSAPPTSLSLTFSQCLFHSCGRSLFALSLCSLLPTAVETLLFTTTAMTQTRAQCNTQVQHLQRQQSCLVSYILKVIYGAFSFFSCSRKKNVNLQESFG
jgi:hypothetical protein